MKTTTRALAVALAVAASSAGVRAEESAETRGSIRGTGSQYVNTGYTVSADTVLEMNFDGWTKIEDVSIKHVRVGIYVKRGANSGSSDADVMHVNIVGNKTPESIGLLVEGYDNTFSNMRIANVHVGVDLRGGGNSMRNLHPLYTCWGKDDYETGVGFLDRTGNNWYSFCYSDNFAVGFRTAGNGHSQFDSCFCMWYSPRGATHRIVQADRKFESTFNDLTVGFHGKAATNAVLKVGEPGGRGVFNRLHGSVGRSSDGVHKTYVR